MFIFNSQFKDTKTLRADLNKRLEQKIRKPIINENTQIKGELTSKSLNKISSGKAIASSARAGFSAHEHFEVANCIDEFFKKAKFISTSLDKKARSNVKSVLYFEIALKINSKKAKAKFTLFVNTGDFNKIYTIELKK